jgi:hypothetical protein
MMMMMIMILAFVLISLFVDGTTGQCTLTVPDTPLSGPGLASLYQLGGDGCDETNPSTAVFVEAAIYRPATGQIDLYTPLVVNAADPVAAIDPIAPTIGANDVVGIWFGSNSNSITLINGGGRRGNGNGVQNGNCVNGGPGRNGSVFGQVAFCNAAAFFAAVNQGIARNRVHVPPLRRGTSGQQCPSTRSFSVVDQDQSDNVLSSYLVVPRNTRRSSSSTLRMAQNTAPNRAMFQNATEIDNGSDNRLLGDFINPALGCTTWTATDLADPSGGTIRNSQALNELQAAAFATAPIALVPAGNPMVLDSNGNQNLDKLNAYRQGVDQPMVASLANASTASYCRNLKDPGLTTIIAQRQWLRSGASPAADVGNNLFTFMAARFAATWENLNCQTLIGQVNPVVPVLNNGVCVGAKFNGSNQVLN